MGWLNVQQCHTAHNTTQDLNPGHLFAEFILILLSITAAYTMTSYLTSLHSNGHFQTFDIRNRLLYFDNRTFCTH